MTVTGRVLGTTDYVSPEQAMGHDVDARSDIYSLGILLFEMLVGEPPFVANSTPAMLVKHISERPTPVTQRRSDVPSDLSRAVMMCLEKEPSMRFPSAGALVTALDTGHVPEMRPPADPGQLVLAQPVPSAPMPMQQGGAYLEGEVLPTPDEVRRWNMPEVARLRRHLRFYFAINSMLLFLSIFTDKDLLGLTVLWSIYVAYRYAKLWSDGYDWRDVFQQAREKELIDVADEFLEYVKAFFNRDKRKELRERNRARSMARRSSASGMKAIDQPPAYSLDPQSVFEAAGTHADRVRHATTDRDEILRLVNTLPERERGRVGDVVRSANVLHERIQALAISLADIERNVVSGGADALEAEIIRLEELANPLDRGSEERVRRLAYLKRQRRAVRDVQERRKAVAEKLETCGDALRQLKLDVLRLRAGAQTHQHVTSLALQAMALAENVDSALYVADEMARATERPSRQQSARPG